MSREWQDAGMVPVARRNLFQNKTRLSISVGGVALAIFLIILLNGFLAGIYKQMSRYIDNSGADLFVAQRGVSNLQGGTSLLPLALTDRVENIEGVKNLRSILTQYVILDIQGKKVTTFLVGSDPKRGGGPWRIQAGRPVGQDDEIVVDKVLAGRHRLELGDKLHVMGRDFTIVGLSADTTSWMVSMIFVTHRAASELFLSPGVTSFLLVSLAEGTTLPELKARLERQVDNVEVLARETVAANDRKLMGGVFDAPLKLMVAIAFLVGALIVGLTIYTVVVEKVKEYGILKALGMRNWRLYSVVFEQALTASVLGFAGGSLLSLAAGRGIELLWPQFLVIATPLDLVQVAGIALLMAAVAGYVPARYVANIDPASVFKR